MEMKLTVRAQLEIAEKCEGGNFANFADYLYSDEWVERVIYVALLLAQGDKQQAEARLLEMTPGELLDFRDEIVDVIQRDYKRKVETEPSKKKEESEV